MGNSADVSGNRDSTKQAKRTWVRFCLVVLFLFSAANIFLFLSIVPKFEQIYLDALPGKPLPNFTNFIIAARVFLAIAAVAWPVLGIVLLRTNKTYAAPWIKIGIFVNLLVTGTTIIALFVPMVGLITGMSDSLQT